MGVRVAFYNIGVSNGLLGMWFQMGSMVSNGYGTRVYDYFHDYALFT